MLKLILIPSMFKKHSLYLEIDKSLEHIGDLFLEELLHEIPSLMEIYETDTLYIKIDKQPYDEGIALLLKNLNVKVEVL